MIEGGPAAKEAGAVEKDLYYIKNGGQWRVADVGEFVRAEGPSACGTWEEVRIQIAHHEGIPESCITFSGTYPRICFSRLADLPAALQYTRRSGITVWCDIPRSLAGITEAANMPCSFAYGGHTIVIGRQWVLTRKRLYYGPDDAEARLAHQAKVGPRDSATIAYSKIPVENILSEMFWIMDEFWRKLRAFSVRFDGRAWHNSNLVRITWPWRRIEFLISIPPMARLCDLVCGKKRWRNRQWRKLVRKLLKYKSDPGMTGSFGKFVRKEARS